jgi:DnaJ-class molecular chaperone
MRERKRKHDDAHKPAFVRTGAAPTGGRFVPTKVCPECNGSGDGPIDPDSDNSGACVKCAGSGEVPQ